MDLRRSCLYQIRSLGSEWRYMEREIVRACEKGRTFCSAWKRFRQRFFAPVIGRVQSSVREVASGGPLLICPITGPS